MVMVVVPMDTNARIDDVGEVDDGLFVLPSRRGVNPEDPGFNPDEFLDTVCEQAMSIQREKLREILARNAEVEYLQRHGLAGRTDVESFRKCIPLVSYSDVEEDILKLVNGDEDQINKPVFTIDPIIFFHRRSSTSTSNCLQLSSVDTSCPSRFNMIFTVVIPHLGDEVFVQYELLLKVTATSVRLIVFPIEATLLTQFCSFGRLADASQE